MLACAMAFFWDAFPRETISGLLGRWSAHGRRWQRAVARPLARVVDVVWWWEPSHCAKIYREERAARAVLYGDQP